MTGEAFRLINGMEMPAKTKDFEFAKAFWDISTQLLVSRKITIHSRKIGIGGQMGVSSGLIQLRESKVSGMKLVYKIDELS